VKLEATIQGGVQLRFSEKPNETIRAALKANGFRWSPAGGCWWRNKVTGAADFIGWLRDQINPPAAQAYPCWRCKQPGELRNYGAAAPVLCEPCHLAHEGQDRVRFYLESLGWMFGRIVRCEQREGLAWAWVEFDDLADKPYRQGFPAHCRLLPRFRLEVLSQ
jgi:hypothetical protein